MSKLQRIATASDRELDDVMKRLRIAMPCSGIGIRRLELESYPDTTDVLRAAIDAARFVLALMSDGVCVTVDYLDSRCIGSSHFFLDSENRTPDTIGNSRAGIRGGNMAT